MNEESRGDSPRREVFSLTEAATLSKCSVDDLLLKGSRDELRICARVPDELVVYSTSRDLLDLADLSLTQLDRKLREDHGADLTALVNPEIRMVVLSPSDCDLVISQGEIYQSRFFAAVSSGPKRTTLIIKPSHRQAGMFRVFACYARTVNPNQWTTKRTCPPAPLKITVDVMHVLNSDLIEERDSRQPIEFRTGFIKEDYMSAALLQLHDVALKHWDRSRPGWTKPAHESVMRSLQNSEEFKNRTKFAEAAATLIRWSFQNWNQRYYESRKAAGQLTPFDALVIVAFAWNHPMTQDPFSATSLPNIAIKPWRSNIGILTASKNI